MISATSLITDLIQSLTAHGFRPVEGADKTIPAAIALLKRQSIIANRAVVVVQLAELPPDFAQYVTNLRNRVAFRCVFFPFLFGIGIQIIVIAPDIIKSGLSPSNYVAKFDNQWAIIQSLFLWDTTENKILSARTWGQVVTGSAQEAIENVLFRSCAEAQSAKTRPQ